MKKNRFNFYDLIINRIFAIAINVFLASLLVNCFIVESAQALNTVTTGNNINQHSPYLSLKLKQLVKAASPNNKVESFILPEEQNFSAIPTDIQNPLTPEKIRLGKLLFHETAMTINPPNQKYWQQGSCATCHFAEAGFKSNLPLAFGVGGMGWNQDRKPDSEVSYTNIDKQKITAPSILNSAYQDVMLWDGRAGTYGMNSQEPFIQKTYINRYGLQGLETQAIDGIKTHKMGTAAIATIPEYQKLFAEAFPDRPYLKAEIKDVKNAGLAIAAYERTILANQAPFQKWLKGDRDAMSSKELKGGIVFFSSSCIHCHTGPNLAISNFRAVGFADHFQEISGLNLGRGKITRKAKDDFKFKVPQLYNLIDSSPYGHGASFKTLREVVEYFNDAEPQKKEALYSGNLSVWFKPLNLSEEQLDDLTAFLETGLRDPNLTRYVPDRIPSGLCFPNNDPLSQKQLNCDSN
ncbi:cytochrome C peroxidase [Waterburya agarophytonicola K14]|uniref:Cytochrome C peroxidase n=1 Tax=Waterburya agarophytonicola KI4 TaxID=2874699 RepID=A0A964BTG5_9CYAN|nr:cytochrome-c peroxidase [Waterburya agarophytonicola]MCC0179358.1 cytochrome C peroxidase [Waterburya agarophytonicola KI4]